MKSVVGLCYLMAGMASPALAQMVPVAPVISPVVVPTPIIVPIEQRMVTQLRFRHGGAGLHIMITGANGRPLPPEQRERIRTRLVVNERTCRAMSNISEYQIERCMSDLAASSWHKGDFGRGVIVITTLPVPPPAR